MEITLQSLLDELVSEGGNLADLLRQYSNDGHLTTEEADRLLAEARQAFKLLKDSDKAPSAADVEQMETLAEAVTAIKAEKEHLTSIAEEQAAKVAEIAARVGLDDEDEDGEGEGDNADESTDDDADDVEVIETIDAGDVIGEAEQIAQDAATVTASSTPRRRVDLSQVAKRTQRPQPPAKSGPQMHDVLLAAAGLSNKDAGIGFESWEEVALAAENRFIGYRNARTTGRHKQGLAVLRKPIDHDLVVTGEGNDTDVLARAVDESRLPNGSLLAAGGWCAPSETLYDLCDLPCAYEGLLSVPEVNAPRGGVRWTPGLDFCAIYNSPGFFHFTEAQMMATNPDGSSARPEKPCMEIPCPTFQECRLDVDGLCVIGDILQRRGYPEVIAQFITGVLCAHAHKMNAWKLQQIYTKATDDGIVGTGGTGATAAILEAIELEVEAYRYRGRRSRNTTLEMIAPYWVMGVIRSDLAKRNGVDMLSVTDEQIRAWFTQRGVRVDFVYDWQDLLDCTNPTQTVTGYPTEVEFILYEAGTWVAATQDVITLDTIYDSALLKKNQYTQLFTEEGICMIERCPGTRRFQVPICPNGQTGSQVDLTCGAPAPAPIAPFAGELVGAAS